MPWRRIIPDVHVLPVNDLCEHVEARDCWCEPRCEQPEPESGVMVVHRAMDGRELVEHHGLQ